MRAAVYYGPRDVRVEQMPEPGPPGEHELVLAVTRAAICGTDASEYTHGPHFAPLRQRHPGSGHLGPIILGHEFVGHVVATGSGVARFATGQRVVPGAGVWCGACEWCRSGRTNLCARYYTLGLHTHGGLAEYATVTEAMCHPVPDALPDESAAIAQPMAVALHAVRRARVERGQTVAIIGVGGIGAFIVAGAAARGAEQLIAVDIADERLQTARTLGATHTINAAVINAREAIIDSTAGNGAHVIIEASGAPTSPEMALSAVRRGGRVLLVGLQEAPRAIDLHAMALREVELTSTLAHVCDTDIPEAIEVLSRSSLASTVVDRVIGLDALVDDGLLALASGTARGKIVIDPRR